MCSSWGPALCRLFIFFFVKQYYVNNVGYLGLISSFLVYLPNVDGNPISFVSCCWPGSVELLLCISSYALISILLEGFSTLFMDLS